MFKNMDQILKQAQVMQEKLKQQLGDMSVEGSSGGGMVTVQMNGNKVITSFTIATSIATTATMPRLGTTCLAHSTMAHQRQPPGCVRINRVSAAEENTRQRPRPRKQTA